MYQLTRLLFALPLVAFVNYRMRGLIRDRLWRNLFTIFLILVVIGYPIADFLSRKIMSEWTKHFVTFGFYCLPFVLYLVPTVILSDLIFVLLRWSKRLTAGTLAGPGWRAGRFWFLMIVPALIVCVGAVNNTRLAVTEYAVDIPRKSSTLRHLRVAFASDFHLGQLTEDDLVERFASKVNALGVDIVLIGGDIQEGARRDENLSRFEKQFRQIRSKYGVYAVTGNHDIRAGIHSEFFARSGIKLLRDSVERIDEGFYLAGRDDPLSGTRKSIDDLLGNLPEDLPVVVLDHRPVDLDRTSRTRVDLQLSGHTHDWQFFPINLFPSEEFELSWGYVKKRKTQFIVTSGVELTRPPVRTAGLSEIIVIIVNLRDNANTVPSAPSGRRETEASAH